MQKWRYDENKGIEKYEPAFLKTKIIDRNIPETFKILTYLTAKVKVQNFSIKLEKTLLCRIKNNDKNYLLNYLL